MKKLISYGIVFCVALNVTQSAQAFSLKEQAQKVANQAARLAKKGGKHASKLLNKINYLWQYSKELTQAGQAEQACLKKHCADTSSKVLSYDRSCTIKYCNKERKTTNGKLWKLMFATIGTAFLIVASLFAAGQISVETALYVYVNQITKTFNITTPQDKQFLRDTLYVDNNFNIRANRTFEWRYNDYVTMYGDPSLNMLLAIAALYYNQPTPEWLQSQNFLKAYFKRHDISEAQLPKLGTELEMPPISAPPIDDELGVGRKIKV